MDILDDMGVSKLSAKVFLKVNYSFNFIKQIVHKLHLEGFFVCVCVSSLASIVAVLILDY